MKKTLLVALGVLALCVWAVPCHADWTAGAACGCDCGAPVVASCGCDSGCHTGCHGGGFLSKCKGLFHHNTCDTCCTTCAPPPCCTTACAPPPCECAPPCGCCETKHHKLFGGCHKHRCNTCPCDCAPPCATCGCGCGH